MRNRASAWALIAASLTMAPAALQNAGPSPQGVTATLRVGVLAKNGTPVRGLTREDFAVRIDGAPVEVKGARLEDALPVLVLVDVTASAGPAGELRSPIARHVLGVLAPDTLVRVASIGRTMRVPGDWTSDRRLLDAQLRQALNVPEVERMGPSPIWDALDESLRTLVPADRRAGILLVTDGQTTGNRVRLTVPADRAMAMGVPISVVFVGSVGRMAQQGDMSAVVRPDRALEQLAVATGGAFFNRSAIQRREWGSGGDPLHRATATFAGAYLLEVSVQTQPGFQRVAVTTRDASHVVRARMGLRTQ